MLKRNLTKAKAEHHRIIRSHRVENEARQHRTAYARFATTTLRVETELPPVADAPIGARVVDASAYAVALCLGGRYLGLFAVGDWGKPC